MRGKKEKAETVKVIGLKAPEGKKQHLVVGKSYNVTEEIAKALVRNKQAKRNK